MGRLFVYMKVRDWDSVYSASNIPRKRFKRRFGAPPKEFPVCREFPTGRGQSERP